MRHSPFTALLLLLNGVARLIKPILSLLAALILISTAGLLAFFLYFARELPAIDTIEDYRPPVISEVFAADGTRIGEFWTECRIFTPYDEIPERVKQAFIDSEDARFFEHKGVDMRSIVRAFLANLRAGEITQGGSTITQQITRSLLLSRERTVTRKIKEAILATRLERSLSKEQILALYLNEIYLGNRAYGVAAAARNYFRRPLAELSLGQIAIIAGLPRSPTAASPINDPTTARERQLHVLSRMVREGHVTEAEAEAAAAERFPIYIAGIDKAFNEPAAAYFVEHVRRLVKEQYGDEVLYHQGLKISTTVDLPMQRTGTRVVRDAVERLDRRQGWRGPLEHVAPEAIAEKARAIEKRILAKQQGDRLSWPPGTEAREAIDFRPGERFPAIVTDFNGTDTSIQIGNVSGVIRREDLQWARPFSTGWLGNEGGNYVRDPKKILKVGDVIEVTRLESGTFALAQEPEVESALLALDPHNGFIKTMVGGYDFGRSEFNRATQALRQPGSSFKPFVYAAALDKGYTYETTIIDEPVVYQVGRHNYWSPKNYGGEFKGPTPFRNALRFSRNVPTVKITFDIGTHYLTAYARKMGIDAPLEKYLSMALGANAVTLREMVQAYAVFANHGAAVPAIAVTKITDAKGRVLEDLHGVRGAAAITPPEPAADAPRPRPALAENPALRDVSPDELNIALAREGLQTIEAEGLVLTDLELRTLYGESIPEGHVITPQTAYLMTTLLKGVVEGGTGSRVRALGKPVAGKTGTTNDETDVWFIGFVPDLVAGVWVGFDELKPIGKRVAGGNTAAPIFLAFMEEATAGWEPKEFERPEGMASGELSTMAGGSALFGARPRLAAPGERGGADRAGQFFEEDLEYFEGGELPPDEEDAPIKAF